MKLPPSQGSARGVLRSTRHGDYRRGGHHALGFLTALLMKTLLKVLIALAAVAVLAVLLVRSAQSTGAQAFTIPARP